MPAVAFGSAARVVALSAVIALSAVQQPRGEGAGTLVYAIHQDSWGSYVLDGLALMHPDGSNQVRDIDPAVIGQVRRGRRQPRLPCTDRPTVHSPTRVSAAPGRMGRPGSASRVRMAAAP